MKYKVHRYDISMTRDKDKLELFLNSLEGKVVAIIPNVTIKVMWIPQVDFLLIIEEIG